ncbi:MAG: alginate export family protein [Nitrosomonadales bacterium]|nr:alginate export family protein [Nitrosomonadales bacterium]
MKRRNDKHLQQSLIAIALLAGSAAAHAAEDIAEALAGGKTSANVQLRHENVKNPGKAAPNSADASTVRLRLGYETGTFSGFSAMVEAESVTALGGKSYDSKATGATANGYAVAPDPEATEMNQAYLSYSSIPASTNVKWGRQRLILDNARFIGNVGWRQNEQTYDALTLVNASLPDTRITAAYLANVNRIFSDNAASKTSGAFAGNHKMSSRLLNVSYKGWGFAELVGYGYMLNYDASTAFTASSTNTYGLRMNGNSQVDEYKLLYTAEYASQSDANNNPTQFKASYLFVEGGVDITSAVFKLGYEVLGADTGATTKASSAATTKSFSTPLATLHAFNGWADMFLVTPTQGLKDIYVSAGTTLAGIKMAAAYHDFSADKSTATIGDYGTEWNLMAAKNFGKSYVIGAKYAIYKTQNAAIGANTNKLWLWAETKF